MFPLSRNFLKFAAASAIVALTAVSTPARADELVQHLGPVGPHEPILATFGNKRVIAFYEPGNGRCELQEVAREREHRGISLAWLLKAILSMEEILAARHVHAVAKLPRDPANKVQQNSMVPIRKSYRPIGKSY